MNKSSGDSRSIQNRKILVTRAARRLTWHPPQLIRLGGSAQVAGKVKTVTNPNEAPFKGGEKGPISPS